MKTKHEREAAVIRAHQKITELRDLETIIRGGGISVAEALEWLCEDGASGEDPVDAALGASILETTPEQLLLDLDDDTRRSTAKEYTVMYYGSDEEGRLGKVHGPLTGMVLDRLIVLLEEKQLRLRRLRAAVLYSKSCELVAELVTLTAEAEEAEDQEAVYDYMKDSAHIFNRSLDYWVPLPGV